MPPPPAETFVLEGRVVDLRGEGVPLAKVHVATWGDRSTALARTVADGTGYFRLPKVPVGTSLQAHATADGYCVGTEPVMETTRDVCIEVHDGATLRGVLRDGRGEPVAGVPVRAQPFGRPLTYVVCDATTDAQGAFVLGAVPLGVCIVQAWIPGQGLFETTHRVAADAEVVLTRTPLPATRLEVTITGLPADAAPVGLSLLPYREHGRVAFPPPLERPRATNGSWVLEPAPDCRYIVTPGLSGFTFAPRRHEVDAGKGPHALRFVATARGTTSLAWAATVRDPDGEPVAGVPFVLRAPNGSDRATATTAADGSMTLQSPLAAGTDVCVYTTDGRWAVDQPKAHHADRRSLHWYEGTFDPKQPLALRVVPACSIRGRVLLADGRPAAFVTVELEEGQANRTPRWMTMAWARTARDGTFRFQGLHHLDAAVRVHVQSIEGAADGEPLALATAGTKVEIGELRLGAPAIVEGVLQEGGAPAAGYEVWLRDWDFDRNGQKSGSVTATITDRQGRFRFLGAPPGGAYLQVLASLEAHPRDRGCEPFVVETGQTVTHDLEVPAR